ncbi:OmpH family outer membrane protein [Novosphingobium lentum]|uniref:OmpH family outer membrane protein n=1 Tax=Novosphingobium lentum TaxID=145287 RepID=UPI000830EF12|nr:OmpH family outer membrane protein [Novosphingobium lentum]
MNTLLKSALLAGLVITAPMTAFAAPKAASGTGTVASGIAVANPSAIVAASTAYQTAQSQRPVTYKAQVDQANSRRNQIAAQLKPLYDKLEADSKAPNANRAALEQQAVQIQQIEQAGEREIQQILAPLGLSQQYVLEQIGDKLDAATQAAMNKQGVTLIIDSQSVVKADQAYNINQAVLAELNTLIPSAQLVPPAGWKPRAQREQEAQQAAQQQGAAPAPATATPPATTKKPTGR